MWSYPPVTDAPPDPVLLLLKLIEDLCATIAQATGLNLFTRLMLIPVRRKLRGMAQAVAEVAADRAARAPDPSPIFVGSDETQSRHPCSDAPAPRTLAVAAPVASPWRDRGPQDQHAALPTFVAAARSGDDTQAGPHAASGAAAAPAMAEAGRCTVPESQVVPAREPAAFVLPPEARSIMALRSAGFAAPDPAVDRKADFGCGILRVQNVAIPQ